MRSALRLERISFRTRNSLAHYDSHFVRQAIAAQEDRIVGLTHSINFNARHAPTKRVRILNFDVISCLAAPVGDLKLAPETRHARIEAEAIAA